MELFCSTVMTLNTMVVRDGKLFFFFFFFFLFLFF